MPKQETTWEDVPQRAIDKELEYWHKKRYAVTVWLVPSRYADGEATCSGSEEMPYSNPLRRRYELGWRWSQVS